MRKRIITKVHDEESHSQQKWLDIEAIAEVEITSEDTKYPIESALIENKNSGWRADKPGKQTIRLVFISPQRINQIKLKFVETEVERTQEYILRWSADEGCRFHEVLRQQWNFSPTGSTTEINELHVNLQGVTVLELIIIPDISDGDVRASLQQLKLA